MKNRKHIEILMNVNEDIEELERLILAHTPRFQTLTKEAENRIQATGGMDHNEFWDNVSKTGEAVCAESSSKYVAKREQKPKRMKKEK